MSKKEVFHGFLNYTSKDQFHCLRKQQNVVFSVFSPILTLIFMTTLTSPSPAFCVHACVCVALFH